MQKVDTIHNYNSSFVIKGNWTARANQLKKHFPELTDADLLFESGRESELLTRIEERLNKNREEVISIIKRSRVERI